MFYRVGACVPLRKFSYVRVKRDGAASLSDYFLDLLLKNLQQQHASTVPADGLRQFGIARTALTTIDNQLSY